jgi:poly(3-hydroxybutyrate) depolymerase
MDWKRVRRWVRLVWVTLGLGLTAWMVWNMQARNVSASLLVASERVQVHTDDDATMFFPAGVPEDAAGLIFLPGGGVDPAAYLPVVRRLADAGLHAALVRLPYRVAPTEASRNEVWQRIIRVRVRWGGKRPVVLAGHSRGGALAARFADQHAMELDGLALVATTHPRDQDLSRVRFPVVKIMGTEDCVAPLDDARGNSGRLPAHTQWVDRRSTTAARPSHARNSRRNCTPHSWPCSPGLPPGQARAQYGDAAAKPCSTRLRARAPRA